MDYNEYDSNGNKRSFNYSSLFTDKKYRSRLILLVYLIFFLVIIFMLRNTDNNLTNNDIINNNLGENENNNIVVDDGDENNDDYSEELKSRFSLIDTKNYNFEYYMYFENDTFVASGKRFENKYDFIFENGKDTIDYKADDKKVIAKDSLENSKYVATNFPYYYVDFFDTTLLKKIINEATKIDDTSYLITNEKLINYVDEPYKFNLDDSTKTKTNEINLELKNNSIVAIEMDISNLLKSNTDEKQKELKIVLKYSNFNLIDNFDVIFD